MEPQTSAPQPANNYDFILNPNKQVKRGLLGGDSFITKILFLVGGAIVLMIIAAVAVNLFFGDRTNLGAIVTLTQTEEEIVRLGDHSQDAGDRQIKNAAINTQLTVRSHQVEWLAFLNKRGQEVKGEQLKLKKDTSSDKRLAAAKQASLFDTTYVNLMRSELNDYSKLLKSAHEGASNQQERALLSKHYSNVQLLLKQWPESRVSLR